MGAKVPVYLSHSYRPEDREINRRYCELFWKHDFAFTVDPKSGEHLNIPHLELMMRRSACFVAIAPYRAEQERVKTSPYIAFEHDMAVRARKPRLVLLESGVAGTRFEDSQIWAFDRDDTAFSDDLVRLVERLRAQSLPLVTTAGRVRGTVGLVLPPSRPYQATRAAIQDLLEAAGYRVHVLPFEPKRKPHVGGIDKHDFFVVDVRAEGMVNALYYRFVPTIKLAYQPSDDPTPLPAPLIDPALKKLGERDDVIRWRDPDDLLGRLGATVEKMGGARRQFRSYEEGVGYFQSLGRRLQGPVFISNASKQDDLARHLSRALDLNNIRFFQYQYRNPIALGTEWERPLEEQVTSSVLFVALVTPEYRRSTMCQRELELASEKGVRIYKYFLEGAGDVAGATERLQGRDLTGMKPHDRVSCIVDDIDGYLTVGEREAS